MHLGKTILCIGIFDLLWLLTLELWPWTQKICPGRYSPTTVAIKLILRIWTGWCLDLCLVMVWSLYDIWPWSYDLDLEIKNWRSGSTRPLCKVAFRDLVCRLPITWTSALHIFFSKFDLWPCCCDLDLLRRRIICPEQYSATTKGMRLLLRIWTVFSLDLCLVMV